MHLKVQKCYQCINNESYFIIIIPPVFQSLLLYFTFFFTQHTSLWLNITMNEYQLSRIIKVDIHSAF